MSAEVVHVDLANRNNAFLRTLVNSANPFSDWIAIVAFYKAVHIAEAVFAANEPLATQHSVDHFSRNHLLKSKYPEIWDGYQSLYNASRIARYLGTHADFSSYMSEHDVISVLLGIDLVNVEAEAVPLLSGAATLSAYGSPVKAARQAPTALPAASPAFTQPPAS